MLQMSYDNRRSFRDWLTENALSDEGLWLMFDKRKPANGLTAAEALEEALSFGWIDGQIQSIAAMRLRGRTGLPVITRMQAATGI